MAAPNNDDLLIEKVNIFIRKYHYNNLLRGLIFLGAGILSAYLVIAITEYYGNFNTFVRTLLFYFFILINIALLLWLVLPPLLATLSIRKPTDQFAAAEIIGKHFSSVNDALLNTLQLKQQLRLNPQHRELLEASIKQRTEKLRPVSFPSAIDLRENNRYLKWAIPPAVVIIIIAFAAPSVLTESTTRLIHHNTFYAPKAPFQFQINNNKLEATQGQDLKLDVILTGNNFPDNVYIETVGTTFKLDKKSIGRFSFLFNNLQQNTRFRLSGNGFVSPAYDIRVHPKPVLLNINARLIYPAYLKKRPEEINNAGDLTLPAGTLVNWVLHTQNASDLLFSLNRVTQTLSPVKSGIFKHRDRLIKPGTYVIKASNKDVSNNDSAVYRINVIADEPPIIQVDETSDSVSIKDLYFNGHIQDDHGFSGLRLIYRIGAGKNICEVRKPVKADLTGNQSNFFFYWDLRSIRPKPGERVSYYFEVADNDAVNGPKAARTPEKTLNIPDAATLSNQLNAGTAAVKQKMASAVKLAGQVEKSAQKLNELLLDKNTLSFDEKKQVEDLLQKRKDLDDLIKEVQDDNKKNLYNRQENQQQTEEIVDMQKQIERLFNNVLDEKTRIMMEQLQKMLLQNQKEATREGLSQMQMDNRSLKKELDRILELYKQLDFEQKINETVNLLQQLSAEQQKLADQSKQNGNSASDLQRQQALNQQFEAIKQALGELKKTSELNGNKQNFNDTQKQQQEISKDMQQGADALKNNNRKQASDAQQQAALKMQQMARQMQEDDAEGQQSSNSINTHQLRELLKSLLNSSFEQEKIMQSLRGMGSSDADYKNIGQKQKNIKDNLKTTEDSLYALSRRMPQIQSSVNKEITQINDHITRAIDDMAEHKTPDVLRSQQFAMAAMNNLALMLSEALDQLQKQKSKSGKGKGNQQSLSQLSKMQQQLSKNMQQAREQMQKQGNLPQGKSGQGGMSEQFAKMARQQQLIRQSLQQLNRENNKDGKNGLGNLDKISKEMEQTENDLVNRKITDEALRRQQQIQNRLLDAEKAEQQREQDDKRESRAAQDLPPGYIKALRDYEQVKAKQTEQVRTAPPALNLYYKQKIKRYFDQLNSK